MTERERMDFDVAIVGGGPAGLATAIHLADLIEKHNAAGGDKLEPEIVLIEKAKEVGAHSISGAVMDPRAIEQLLPDWREHAPIEAEVHKRLRALVDRKGWLQDADHAAAAAQPRQRT